MDYKLWVALKSDIRSVWDKLLRRIKMYCVSSEFYFLEQELSSGNGSNLNSLENLTGGFIVNCVGKVACCQFFLCEQGFCCLLVRRC